MTRTLAAVVALALLCPGLSTATPDEDLSSLWSRFVAIPKHRMQLYGSSSEPSDPVAIVQRSTTSGRTAPELAVEISRTLGLTEDAGAGLLRAILEDGILRSEQVPGGRQDIDPERLGRIETGYRQAAEGRPGNVVLLVALSGFYSRWSYAGFFRDFPSRVAAVVRLSSDPGLTAMELAVGHAHGKLLEELLPIAWKSYPDHPAVIAALRRQGGPFWNSAALAEIAFRKARSSPAVDPDVLTAIAEDWLSDLSFLGLTDEVIRVFEHLPEETSRRILQGEVRLLRGRLGKLPYSGSLRDVRLELAACYLMEGRGQRAREIVRQAIAVGGDPGRVDKRKQSQKALLMDLTDPPSPEDPFDELVEVIANQATGPNLWARVFARHAERLGYPDLALDKLEEVSEYVRSTIGGKSREPSVLVPGVAEAGAALRARASDLREPLTREIDRLRPPQPAQEAVDGMARTMGRLLDNPTSPRYTEKPLPPDVSPIEMSHEQQYAELKRLTGQIPFPAEFWVQRLDGSGEEILALGSPSGGSWTRELASGGYWLIRSRDGGRTWTKPLYLGLRRDCPYSIRSFSDLPLIEGDRLQIEVDAWQREGPCPTYSHVITHAPTKRSGIVVEIALARLATDEDRDGLTDYLEEDLLTDPTDADTDRDGVGDADDLLPNVAPDRSVRPEREAFAPVLEHFVQWRERMIVGRRRPVPREELAVRSWLESSIPRTFAFVWDRRNFGPLPVSARIVVLTPEEWKKAREKIGTLQAVFVSVFLLDRTKTKGVVRWSGPMEGGTLKLQKTETGWIVEEVSYVVA